MAKSILRNVKVTVDSTVLSDHANEVTIEDTAAEVDVTGFSSSAYREFAQGLKDATITVRFYQDFAAASVEHILQPLYASGGTFSVKVVPDASSSVSDLNPEYSMVSRLYSFSPIAGAVGDANMITATFRNAGTAGVVRGTV